MNDVNDTTDLIAKYCGDWAWMCEKLAQEIVDVSQKKEQNMSDVLTNINNKGKSSLRNKIEYTEMNSSNF